MWGAQDSEPKTGDGQRPLDGRHYKLLYLVNLMNIMSMTFYPCIIAETSQNGTSGIMTAQSHATLHQTMQIMPMLAAGVPGVVSGPTTNLNIGMHYWTAPTPSAISPLHGMVSATATTGAMVPGSLVEASKKVPSEIWLQVFSQLGPGLLSCYFQAEYEELAQHVEVLKEENSALRAEVDQIKKEYDGLIAQNGSLQVLNFTTLCYLFSACDT
ncbi:hypothetical protein BHM03_00045971 [Ensete ventricosum]|nr:hypothetical protein BHM03_00045971 [Ensete ventricosum]